MNNFEGDIKDSLKRLNETIEDVYLFFSKEYDYSKRINTLWSAKDILGHLVFWHESFERNLKCVATELKPNVLKGKLSDVNKQSVDSMRDVDIATLLDRFGKAQRSIQRHIFNTSVQYIPYKQGSRDYTRLEHLQIVDAHIKKHLKQLKKRI
ncbi:hypothetical protein LV716_04505 [Flagellimonas sp. HMM57]|uniref:hypothetical protein n=1 Tax=unclassified Flagellimonas TaxID=2644544 RepID=UPI001969ACBD|nr:MULTISPECIES: hypothetical protein [unclassified Flagellimonas]UII77057.1 hypothetical protein LV716_04505 [Flagellimonas sp. HMM57]